MRYLHGVQRWPRTYHASRVDRSKSPVDHMAGAIIPLPMSDSARFYLESKTLKRLNFIFELFDYSLTKMCY